MGWGRAVDAAWQAFGVRYWKLIVGYAIVRRLLVPFLVLALVAGIGAGGWWARTRMAAPSGPWPWWLLAGACVAAVLLWVRSYSVWVYRPSAYRLAGLALVVAAAVPLLVLEHG